VGPPNAASVVPEGRDRLLISALSSRPSRPRVRWAARGSRRNGAACSPTLVDWSRTLARAAAARQRSASAALAVGHDRVDQPIRTPGARAARRSSVVLGAVHSHQQRPDDRARRRPSAVDVSPIRADSAATTQSHSSASAPQPGGRPVHRRDDGSAVRSDCRRSGAPRWSLAVAGGTGVALKSPPAQKPRPLPVRRARGSRPSAASGRCGSARCMRVLTAFNRSGRLSEDGDSVLVRDPIVPYFVCPTSAFPVLVTGAGPVVSRAREPPRSPRVIPPTDRCVRPAAGLPTTEEDQHQYRAS
jgi:hypothetical protein